MRNRMLITGLLLLVAVSLAGAQGAIPLRYRMTKGEALTYKCTTVGNGTLNAMGRTDPIKVNSSFIYVMSCTGVDRAGNMTIVHRISNLSVTATWAGQPLPVAMSLPAITTVISPTGTVLNTQVHRGEGPPGASLGGVDLGGLLGGLSGLGGQESSFDVSQFLGELHGPGFPQQGVDPGNRWQQALKMLTQTGQPMVLTYVTKFLDFAKLNGRNCVRLQTEYELPLDLSLMGGGLFNVTGKQTGTQVVYFDYVAGRVARFDGTADTSINMATPQLFSMGGAQQTTVSANIRTNTSVVLQ